MKMPTDFSDTLSRSAHEARGILLQTASLLEAEWKRLVDTVEESESVPAPVKTAFDRLGGTVDDLKEFVTTNGPKVVSEGCRVARQAGVPIPEDWPGATPDAAADNAGETVADAAADNAGETVADAAKGPFTDGDDVEVDADES